MKEPKRWENFHVHKPEARAGMYNPLGRGLGIIRSFLLPLYTVVRPREAYRRLRHVVKKSSPIMRLMLVFWAYIGFAFLSMIAVFFGSLYYSITPVSYTHL
ncbi:MAG: hypothetical protein F7C32_03700, partial [Desulfurococcales archaeon]|nr:hypothetical protein [Desulfurococcales archaeon]